MSPSSFRVYTYRVVGISDQCKEEKNDENIDVDVDDGEVEEEDEKREGKKGGIGSGGAIRVSR